MPQCGMGGPTRAKSHRAAASPGRIGGYTRPITNISTAKLDAYVSGVNAYLTFLRANPTLMPGEYAQISAALTPNDIPDWTEADEDE